MAYKIILKKNSSTYIHLFVFITAEEVNFFDCKQELYIEVDPCNYLYGLITNYFARDNCNYSSYAFFGGPVTGYRATAGIYHTFYYQFNLI